MTPPCPICGGLLTRTIPVPPADAVIGYSYPFELFELQRCPCTEAPLEFEPSSHPGEAIKAAWARKKARATVRASASRGAQGETQ